MEEVLDMVSFLHDISNYFMIAPKDKYKIALITNWGTFVQIVIPFGLKNAPPAY
jgi:hypothetical protein